MKLDMTGWTDKDSKHKEFRELYEKADTFVEAYAAHTDLRIKNVGPAAAIGGEWETHGPLQLDFLRRMGMTPDSSLLDLGCGTGRLARHAVPYLCFGSYVGLDISRSAIEHCNQLSRDEGWIQWTPLFMASDGTLEQVKHRPYEYIWAHSVFTHLPPEIIKEIFKEIEGMSFGVFYFTYKRRMKEDTIRTGLKQFGYSTRWLIKEANRMNMLAEPMDYVWPASQRTMKVWKPKRFNPYD